MTGLPEGVDLHIGNCVDVLAGLPANSIDAILTDPPYALGFMGMHWDRLAPADRDRTTGERRDHGTDRAGGYERAGVRYIATGPSDGLAMQQWHQQWAEQALRVAKPGAWLAAFGSPRTWHRMTVALEDAGWEIRDTISWLHGGGMPKSHNVSKAIDQKLGATRTIVEQRRAPSGGTEALNRANADTHGYRPDPYSKGENVLDITTAGSPEAAQWEGWGTALKPGWEPVVLARKPLEGTVADNVLTHGVGGINIDGGRIDVGDREPQTYQVTRRKPGAHLNREGGTWRQQEPDAPTYTGHTPEGRWPANVACDDTAAEVIDDTVGVRTSGKAAAGGHRINNPSGQGIYGGGKGLRTEAGPAGHLYGDSGGPSRFYFCAKAPQHERPRYTKPVLRLRADLTPEQEDHVRARLVEAGVQVD